MMPYQRYTLYSCEGYDYSNGEELGSNDNDVIWGRTAHKEMT